MSRKNVKVIRDYLDFEDLIKKSGYKVYKPKIGSVGRALIKASKSHRSIGWLKNQLDAYFRSLRQNKKGKNGNQK